MQKELQNFINRNRTLILIAEIISAIFVTSLIVFGVVPLIKVISTFLIFMIILEIMRMIREFIRSKSIKISMVLDSFIIFFVREIVLIASDTEKYSFDEQMMKVGFLLLVVLMFFIFRIMSLKYSPNDKNCETCPAVDRKSLRQSLASKSKEENCAVCNLPPKGKDESCAICDDPLSQQGQPKF
ncbi:MAG: phosphate-starvation-inducible PsiE family protein [Sulfurimonadaceae bacterium]|nr:phosphate-starvation-inducible PsiE family protein [Sulfurimonadaceae bacterium]